MMELELAGLAAKMHEAMIQAGMWGEGHDDTMARERVHNALCETYAEYEEKMPPLYVLGENEDGELYPATDEALFKMGKPVYGVFAELADAVLKMADILAAHEESTLIKVSGKGIAHFALPMLVEVMRMHVCKSAGQGCDHHLRKAAGMALGWIIARGGDPVQALQLRLAERICNEWGGHKDDKCTDRYDKRGQGHAESGR